MDAEQQQHKQHEHQQDAVSPLATMMPMTHSSATLMPLAHLMACLDVCVCGSRVGLEGREGGEGNEQG